MRGGPEGLSATGRHERRSIRILRRIKEHQARRAPESRRRVGGTYVPKRPSAGAWSCLAAHDGRPVLSAM